MWRLMAALPPHPRGREGEREGGRGCMKPCYYDVTSDAISTPPRPVFVVNLKILVPTSKQGMHNVQEPQIIVGKVCTTD